MATKAMVRGLKIEGDIVDPSVFSRDCYSLQKIFEAVEDAFDAGANRIILDKLPERRAL